MGKSKRRDQQINNNSNKQQERATRAEFRRQRRLRAHEKLDEKDVRELNEQLRPRGLEVHVVGGDGNCLFRSAADQIEDNQSKHQAYRQTVVDYIVANREFFEPFIEDDEPWEEYIENMRKDGTWGGNIELQALSMAHRVNIVIHQNKHPSYEIANFPSGHKTIHLSYHHGEHYNSVRPLSVDAAQMNQIAATDTTVIDTSAPTKEELIIMNSTQCNDLAHVRQLMLENGNDVDTVIEILVAEAQIALYGGGEDNDQADKEGEVDPSKPTDLEQRVMDAAPWAQLDHVQQILQEHKNDAKSAIDFLVMEHNIELAKKSASFKDDTNNNVKSSNNNNNNKKSNGTTTTNNKRDSSKNKPTTTSNNNSTTATTLSNNDSSNNNKSTATTTKSNSSGSNGSGSLSEETINLIHLIMEMTDFHDIEFIQRTLQDTGNDFEATVQHCAIQRAITEESPITTNKSTSSNNKICGSGTAVTKKAIENNNNINNKEAKKAEKEEKKRENNLKKVEQLQQQENERAMSKKERRRLKKQQEHEEDEKFRKQMMLNQGGNKAKQQQSTTTTTTGNIAQSFNTLRI